MQKQISDTDVSDLVAALSDGHREAVSAQLGQLLKRTGLPPAELKAALQMIDTMMAQSVETVRKGLAAHIAESPMLPRPMIERLLADVDAVALPIVQLSPLLDEADLLQQMERGAAFQEGIAARTDVTAKVSEQLADTASETAVAMLMRNDRAEVSGNAMNRAVDRFQDSTDVMGAVASRPGLPLEIAERLVSLTVAEECIQTVSDLMMQTLVRRHDLPPVLAEDLIVHGRERSVVDMVRQSDDWTEIEKLAERMHRMGRLSTSLMLRVLAGGDYQFFIAGMAQLTGWQRDRVVRSVEAAGVDPFRKLYEQSGLEPMLFHAFRVARDEMIEARKGEHDGREAFIDRVVGRIAEEYRSISPAGLEQVLTRLRGKAAERL
ncbi:MAG: DUF2336 domain-containing protein [Minwuia sp.]|uniref:DUF2336 domain-containing protein n=1 Tax=Minwuia sp. TaxID=2493630 RepID=UPI003A8C3FED